VIPTKAHIPRLILLGSERFAVTSIYVTANWSQKKDLHWDFSYSNDRHGPISRDDYKR
jgi:hypothetical protein